MKQEVEDVPGRRPGSEELETGEIRGHDQRSPELPGKALSEDDLFQSGSKFDKSQVIVVVSIKGISEKRPEQTTDDQKQK